MNIEQDTSLVNREQLLISCLESAHETYLKLLETFASPKAYRELGKTIRCLVQTLGENDPAYDEVSEDTDDFDNDDAMFDDDDEE